MNYMEKQENNISLNNEENEKQKKTYLFSEEIDAQIEEDFISFTPENYKAPLLLRKQTNDALIYQDIFTDECYKFKKIAEFKNIIDVGAYTGFSSIYFANKYPKATIIALEPAVINRAICSLNSKFYPQINILPVALWPKKEDLFLFNNEEGSEHFQAGPQVKITDNALYPIAGMSLDTILKTTKINRIDLLKISVEGIENTILKSASEWIKKVDSLIIRTNSTTALVSNPILKTIKNLFKESWQKDCICFFTQGGIGKD